MADAGRPIHVQADRLIEASSTVAEHMETSAKQPTGAAPHVTAPVAPVDTAASAASGAIRTKMTRMSAELAAKGPATQQAATAAAVSLTAQDAANSARLPSIPSPPTGQKPQVHALDRTLKRDPPPPPPSDPGRHPNYPDHKPNGEWAPGNTGREGYPEEQRVFDEREQRTGIPIEREKIRVTLTDPNTGKTLRREYDALEPIPGHPGQYRGLEHKLGDKDLTPPQKVFDGLVNDGNVAHGTLNGKPIEVTGTETIRTPRVPADGSAPIISAPPNAPTVLDHPPGAPAPVNPAHPPASPLPPPVFDHPPPPPWLQDPSPPGFHVSPSVPPDFAPWDTPGDHLPLPHQDPPFSWHLPDWQLPDLGLSQQQLNALENELGVGGILGLIVVGGLVVAAV